MIAIGSKEDAPSISQMRLSDQQPLVEVETLELLEKTGTDE